jgi:hypothetical protein
VSALLKAKHGQRDRGEDHDKQPNAKNLSDAAAVVHRLSREFAARTHIAPPDFPARRRPSTRTDNPEPDENVRAGDPKQNPVLLHSLMRKTQ